MEFGDNHYGDRIDKGIEYDSTEEERNSSRTNSTL